ncbi:ATP-binding protein [Xanthobacter sp. ZOL 2024]
MIRRLDSLAARTAVVAVLGIVLVHLASLWTYQHAMERERRMAHAARLAEQLVSVQRALALVAPDERESVAHSLSGGAIDAHWNRAPVTAPNRKPLLRDQALESQVRALAPVLAPEDVVIGATDDPYLAFAALRLPDGSWANVRLFAPPPQLDGGHGSVLSTSLMALGVLLLSLAIAAWLTRPLRAMARAVAQVQPDRPFAPLPENGPREVRELAHAFNGMQARIADLIGRRTQALVAVSHDLRTPMTRLRFRAEDVADPSLREALVADISEMEQMVEATLSYLRGDNAQEPSRPMDLVPLLETIVNDARDQGREVQLDAPASLVVAGRPIALKRAVTNLVENALSYGGSAHLTLADAGDRVSLTVRDHGPGIPEAQLETVLEPFVRLDASRSRATGGVGLGLTIAAAAARSHGGALILANHPEGGLVVTLTLPRIAAETN